MPELKSAVSISLLVVLTACSSSAQPARQMAPTEVVATVGSQSITLGEVDALALQQSTGDFGNVRLVQALYLARRAALEEIIGNRLMDQEAAARHIERAALIQQEITSKTVPPTDDDLKFWYTTNPERVQGGTFEQLKAPIRSLLVEERTYAARDEFIGALRTKTPVTVSLDAPRQTIATAGRPERGPRDAPIEMVEFSDFQCPFCLRANPTVNQILQTYGDRVHFVYRHYPLPNHPNARPAAEAAACAEEQGKFWEYHDRLFANANKLTDADLKTHATALGLDATRFNTCFDEHRFKARIDEDMKDGSAAGVTGTPAFFINGRSLEGAQPLEAFKRLIEEELQLKKK